MQPAIKITYVNGRGNAERIRFVLAGANLDWEEVYLTEGEERKQLVASGVCFGDQIPLLNIDGLNLSQSWSIIRYLGETRDLVPSDVAGRIKVDMFCEVLRSYETDASFTGFGWGGANESAQKVVDASNKWLPRLEKSVEHQAPTHFSFGAKPTYGDFVLLHYLLFLEEIDPNALNSFPKLQAIKANLLKLPQIQKFLSSDKRKPQVTEEYKAIVRKVFY